MNETFTANGVAGIDVGKKGAFAWIDDGVVTINIQPMLGKGWDEKEMSRLCAYPYDHVFIEAAQARTLDSRGRVLTFGTHFGLWRGMLTANGRAYTIVAANKWKRAMGVTKDKQSSILMAQRLFPGVNLLPTPRCTKPSDGMAEALLIAEYGRRVLCGKT